MKIVNRESSIHPSNQQTLVAALLVLCVVLVGFWEIMSNRSRGSLEAFELTSDDLRGFAPRSDQWRIRSFPVVTTPMEPNIGAYLLTPQTGEGMTFIVRLVHGYNMCDCMRIKGYEVELLFDTRLSAADEAVARHTPHASRHAAPSDLQVWRLTSATGDVSIWVTTMLRAGDFAATDADVRSMAFPRIGIPDDPNWMPRGITLRSLRHPIRNLRMALRAKWNNSRCDILTFLGLKHPAWASDELLTLVSLSREPVAGADDERSAVRRTVEVHTFMRDEFQAWRKKELEGE